MLKSNSLTKCSDLRGLFLNIVLSSYTLVLYTLVQDCDVTITVICFIGERGGGSNILTREITLRFKSTGCWDFRFLFSWFLDCKSNT